jgi:ABC-type phosphate transport system substrate-binding protein
VVVHPSNPVASLPRDRVSAMFLKKVGEWPQGGTVLPVDLSAAGGLRDAFGKDVHGKDIAAILSYWKQMIASGRGVPPPVKATDAEVVAYVRGNPGAIGYVSANTPTDGVKVLRLD